MHLHLYQTAFPCHSRTQNRVSRFLLEGCKNRWAAESLGGVRMPHNGVVYTIFLDRKSSFHDRRLLAQTFLFRLSRNLATLLITCIHTRALLYWDAICGQLLHIGIAYLSYASFVVQRRLTLQKIRWRTWWIIGFSLAPLFEKGFYFWFLHWVFDGFCTKLCVLYPYTIAQIITGWLYRLKGTWSCSKRLIFG